MKRIFTILVAVLLTAMLWAQSPEKMSYQAVIRDASDNLITSQNVGMQISILQGSTGGTAVYIETHTQTTNANGLVSVEVGGGTVVSGDFAAIEWENGPYFIKTETDPTGSTSYTITGTSQLLSVPYALHAKTAEIVTGVITETDPAFSSSEAADITATDITNLSNLSGVNTGDQDLSTLATKTALGDSTAQVRSEIPDVDGYLSLPSNPATGDVLTWNGTSWDARISGVGSCIAKLADAPTTYLTIGNYQFRYNSTTTGGYIEVKAISGNDNMMVFATKRTGSWYLVGTSTTINYRNNSSVGSSWNPLISLWDGSTWGDRVTLTTYDSFEATIFSMGIGDAIPLKAYKIFAAIDGYNQVFIRVEYNID
jgi:hypothetical protein